MNEGSNYAKSIEAAHLELAPKMNSIVEMAHLKLDNWSGVKKMTESPQQLVKEEPCEYGQSESQMQIESAATLMAEPQILCSILKSETISNQLAEHRRSCLNERIKAR